MHRLAIGLVILLAAKHSQDDVVADADNNATCSHGLVGLASLVIVMFTPTEAADVRVCRQCGIVGWASHLMLCVMAQRTMLNVQMWS
jgi:hypothetical protein